MSYEFNGEIFEQGKRTFIKIPFNLWDKCGQKGTLPAKVTIEDYTYECKLIPKGNGIYYIPVIKSDFKKFDVSKKLKISFEIISALSRINKNSPYSTEHPIRKIDSIQLVVQPKSGLCGQSCIAMLSGVALNEAINLMGPQCSMSKVIEALDYFGISHADRMVYKLEKDAQLPKCCIINCNSHFIIYFDGRYYDPVSGLLQQYDSNKITGLFEIFI